MAATSPDFGKVGMMVQAYSPPVSQLLNFEECRGESPNKWPDYVEIHGFTDEHIPELLRLMQDAELYGGDPEVLVAERELPPETNPDLVWSAPIHAWRSLGQLKTMAFLDGAIAVLDTDLLEWALEEFPEVCHIIGPATLTRLRPLIIENLASEHNVSALIEAVWSMPEHYPDTRDDCVAILQDALTTYEQNTQHHNTIIVLGLQELKAVESLELMEQVYQSERIDEFFVGSWATAQIELGVKAEADFTEAELKPKLTPEMEEFHRLAQEFLRRDMPDAQSLGLPTKSDQLYLGDVSGFGDLVNPATAKPASKPGFGPTTKGKKGKKKKR